MPLPHTFRTAPRKWIFVPLLPLLFCAITTGAAAASFTVPSAGLTTIGQAMIKARAGDTVWVEPGVYRENVFVTAGVVLASRALFKAEINGKGKKNVVTLGANCTVSGFDIINGDIGVYSTTAGSAVVKCRIRLNKQTGIMAVGNLPRLEDNLIVYNSGSGIQGWDIRTTIASVNHNTIAYNGNNGFSVGGNSDILLENNIIAFNQRIGLKTEPPVTVSQKNNCYFDNTEVSDALAESNIGADPQFRDAQHLDFKLAGNSQCRNNGSDNLDIGARITY
jgi:hypothetical protein